jgi:YVTN family beta-propeller protein
MSGRAFRRCSSIGSGAGSVAAGVLLAAIALTPTAIAAGGASAAVAPTGAAGGDAQAAALTAAASPAVLAAAEARTAATGSAALVAAPIPRPAYLSPDTLVLDPKRRLAYTALSTAAAIAVTDLAKPDAVARRVPLTGNPNGLAVAPDGSRLYAATGEARGVVEVLELPSFKRVATWRTGGHTPSGMALSADGKTLYVANRFTNTVAVLDVSAAGNGRVLAQIPAVREPHQLALSPDGKTLAVSNFLPVQAATAPDIACELTLVDTAARRVRANTVLYPGAQSLAGVAFSPDGRFVYALHILSRFGVPITQLDRGWVNTSALTLIEVKDASIFATVLLDDPDNGAAVPHALAFADGGRRLYVALAGTHEVLALENSAMVAKLEEFFAGKVKIPNVEQKADLNYSLSFTAAFKKRIALKGRGPRALAVLPANANGAGAGGGGGDANAADAAARQSVLVATRFSTALEKLDFTGGDFPRVNSTLLPLGDEPAPDAIRRGEANFNDASICYQQWQSCASCHPDGRADGINWDQRNDGLGNPKNTKSFVFSHVTPPCMITGVRATAEKAVRAGIQHTLGTRQPEQFAADIDEYMKALRPLESPFLAEYRAKDPKGRGKKIFDDAGCADCHNGPFLTDRQLHDVGTGDAEDTGRPFDTPTLHEVWRTAPYLYDGRAATLHDVFTKFNKNDKHGVTSKLSKQDLDALILYVNAL